MFVETETRVTDFVKGLRRVGNRLSLHSKAAKSTVNKRDGKRFLDSAVRFVSGWYNDDDDGDLNFCLDVRGGLENVCEGAFNWVVHNMDWKEYVDWIKDRSNATYVQVEELQWFKLIYDNPAIFNEEDK